VAVGALALALSRGVPAWAGPALLFDVTGGQVLYAEDQDNQWHPASLTKIMTAYLTFGAIRDGSLTLQTTIYLLGFGGQPGSQQVRPACWQNADR
jgi:D-alanyl-D-alanine carboxypeptidase